MRPAFSSIKQAAAFGLLLLLLLLAPVLIGKSLLPPREQSYEVQGWGNGPFPWIRDQIFDETNTIDIAFMGSSHIWNAINTPYVQAQLSKKLGRPAVVRTIAWGGAGFDGLYFIASDLLSHRRVRMLVFYDEDPDSQRNAAIPALFRLGDQAGVLHGLSFREKSLFYCASLIGLPRNLLSLVRSNLPAQLVTDKTNYWTLTANAPNPATRLGSLSVGRGFAPNPMAAAAPFVPYKPATAATPADAMVFSPATKDDFQFASAPLPAWQMHFAQRLAALFLEHHVKPVMLYLPDLAEVRSPVIPKRGDWPTLFTTDTTLLGIPPARLFAGLSDADILKLYGDPVHFNRNGQEYFTPLITPALMHIYETAAHP